MWIHCPALEVSSNSLILPILNNNLDLLSINTFCYLVMSSRKAANDTLQGTNKMYSEHSALSIQHSTLQRVVGKIQRSPRFSSGYRKTKRSEEKPNRWLMRKAKETQDLVTDSYTPCKLHFRLGGKGAQAKRTRNRCGQHEKNREDRKILQGNKWKTE